MQLEALLRTEQSREGNDYYLLHIKKKPTDSKIWLLSLGSALRSLKKYLFKICFYSLELPMTIALIFLLCYYIQPSPDEVW